MDCILRVIKGPDTGASCKLQPGSNLVGRSLKAALKLTPSDISWEHLAINRNGDQCLAENLSASGSYLDDARLSGPVKLRPRDQLRLSKDTVLRYETTGGADSNNKGILLLLLILLVAVAVVVFMVSAGDRGANWDGAYNQLETWTQGQALGAKMPADIPRLFRNAWRLEQAEDYAGSRTAWLRLKMLLDTVSDRYAVSTQSPEHAQALEWMLTPPSGPHAEPTDQDFAAALNQFVTRRLSWSTLQAQSRSSR